MIVRVWRARATPENALAYRAHLETHVFPTLRSIGGFVSADLMERRDGDEVECVVTTRWASIRAVREFAGDAYENAVVAPAARSLLSSYDEQVAHYEVTVEGKA
jgi:hypothetical protein